MNIDSIENSETFVIPVSEVKRTQIAPRGKMLWNVIARFGGQFVAVLANLLVTPYIIRKLGVESYGIVGVINTMISYMAIITTSLTATVGRNLTFAIERQEYEKANKEISTAVYAVLRIFVIAFLPLCAFSLFIDQLIIIPQTLVSGARIFCFLSITSFVFATISGPLGASMFVRNRLDLTSGANLARTLVFIGTIVTLFSTFGASLPMYGIAMITGSILLFSIHLRIHKYLLKSVEISKHWFDRTLIKDIVSLGGWMTLSQIGGLLFLQTTLLVANRTLGPLEAGQLAAISVIPLQMRVFSGLVSSLFGPTQAAIAARRDWVAFSAYLLSSIRLTILFFSLLVGVFCGSAREVLSIWLGNEFAPLVPVALVLTGYLILGLGSSPLSSAVLMLGKVKVPAIVTVIMGAVNVILSVILAHIIGLMGIALAQCVTLLFLNAVFVPWYVSRACKMSLWLYIREQCLGVGCGAVIALISYGMNSLIHPDSLAALVLSISLSAILGLLVLLPFGLHTIKHKLKE